MNQHDELWMIIDKDNWKDEQLAGVAQECVKQKFNLAVSTPSFEIWILLHFEEFDQQKHGSLTARELKKYLSNKHNSGPKNLQITNYRTQVLLAIQRATILDKNPNMKWPKESGTRVYLLVEKILTLD